LHTQLEDSEIFTIPDGHAIGLSFERIV
jgi:hypothetical protein